MLLKSQPGFLDVYCQREALLTSRYTLSFENQKTNLYALPKTIDKHLHTSKRKTGETPKLSVNFFRRSGSRRGDSVGGGGRRVC